MLLHQREEMSICEGWETVHQQSSACRGRAQAAAGHWAYGDAACTATQGWESPGHASPCSCKCTHESTVLFLHPRTHPSLHPSVFVSFYTHLFLCHQFEGLFCLCSLPSWCGHRQRHIILLLFPWAPLPRRSAPPVLPSFPALTWCQLELISPKHR